MLTHKEFIALQTRFIECVDKHSQTLGALVQWKPPVRLRHCCNTVGWG